MPPRGLILRIQLVHHVCVRHRSIDVHLVVNSKTLEKLQVLLVQLLAMALQEHARVPGQERLQVLDSVRSLWSVFPHLYVPQMHCHPV